MEDSVLDKITQHWETVYDGWRNGVIGAICDFECNGIYRFIEYYVDKSGRVRLGDLEKETSPVVCVGIAAYWLAHRKCENRLLTSLKAHQGGQETVREMYENYTEMRFRQYKDGHRDDARMWDWEESDWRKHFFCDFIIQNETELNTKSETLFYYIPESDTARIRPVMEHYIDYLEKQRKKYLPPGKLVGVLDTLLARTIFPKCIEKGWMHETESEYHWDGIENCRGRIAQLAYLCGRIYGFKYDGSGGNKGTSFPGKELDKLFGEKSLEKQLVQVYAADKPQKWRTLIDELFK